MLPVNCTASIVRGFARQPGRVPGLLLRIYSPSYEARLIPSLTLLATSRYKHECTLPSVPKTPSAASSTRNITLPGIPTPSTQPPQPSYRITFTCTPCSTASTHSISKHGYHHGSILITCPSCHNRHVISDHLGMFSDRKITIEELMKEKGSSIKKGTLGTHGDVEWWDGNAADQLDQSGDPLATKAPNENERKGNSVVKR